MHVCTSPLLNSMNYSKDIFVANVWSRRPEMKSFLYWKSFLFGATNNIFQAGFHSTIEYNNILRSKIDGKMPWSLYYGSFPFLVSWSSLQHEYLYKTSVDYLVEFIRKLPIDTVHQLTFDGIFRAF